jgi:ribosomal protein S18 acetylase RimI-like enzyme
MEEDFLVRIRPATIDDAADMARVRVDTWRSAYSGIVPADHLESLCSEGIAEGWRRGILQSRSPDLAAYVAEEAPGRVVGIAMCGQAEGQERSGVGQVYVLYVLPEFQRRRVGHALMQACGRHLVERGMTFLIVWVLKDNPYRSFYERLGGVLAGEKQVEIGNASLLEVAYEWTDIREAPWMEPPQARNAPGEPRNSDAA